MYDRCQRVQVNGMTKNFNAHLKTQGRENPGTDRKIT
jgi:hypothetical protein